MNMKSTSLFNTSSISTAVLAVTSLLSVNAYADTGKGTCKYGSVNLGTLTHDECGKACAKKKAEGGAAQKCYFRCEIPLAGVSGATCSEIVVSDTPSNTTAAPPPPVSNP